MTQTTPQTDAPERKPVTKHQVIALHKEHPDWTAPQIARHIGCSREYVYATGRRNDLSIPKHMGRFERLEAENAALTDERNILRDNFVSATDRIQTLEGENAALRAQLAAAREVKKLVWEMQRPDGTLWATDLETSYIVVHAVSWRAKKRALVIGTFDSPEEAKAACQADYERRIRAALVEGGE